jgi:hypothetical protein
MLLVGFAGLAVLGFGSALLLAGNGKPESTVVTLCHAPPGTPENLQKLERDASQILGNEGHAEHPYDIIPVFVYTVDGTTSTYEGKNLTITDGWGATGDDVLANGCLIATTGTTTGTTGSTTETTETTVTTGTSQSVTTVTTTVPTTVTVPATTVTLPPETVTNITTITVTVPATTVTLPGSTTVVTESSGSTTTVTVPGSTVTVPASTVKKELSQIFTPPRRIVPVPAHVLRAIGAHHLVERIVVRRLLQRKVIIIVIHVHSTGTAPSSGLKGAQTGIGKG